MGFCQVVKCSEEANLTCLEGLTLYNLQHPVWNAKVESQEIPGVTGKFGLRVQNKTGQRLTEFCREHTGHSKHPLPTTQEKILHMDITRWSIPKSD